MSSHRVVALVPPGVPPFELGIVVEVFGLERPELDVPWWYSVTVCTEHPGRRPASVGGFGFHIEHGLEALADADTIIVPGWHGEVSAELIGALRGARTPATCRSAAARSCSPRPDCSTGARRRRTGATRSGWRRSTRACGSTPTCSTSTTATCSTSAGSAAGIDLCLHIVRRDHGSAVANSVARRLVIPPHRDGGQAQLIELPMPPHPEDDPIARVMAWALERLQEPLSLDVLAAQAYMSVRTFTRRFGRATGMTPGRWLIEQRVRASLPLLEGGDEPIETVAARVGFGSAATYRHHFAAIMRTSPTAYRRAFFGLPVEGKTVAESSGGFGVVLQAGAAAVQAAHDGADRDRQHLGGLGVAEPDDVDGGDHLALRGRQLVDLREHLAAVQDLDRLTRGGGDQAAVLVLERGERRAAVAGAQGGDVRVAQRLMQVRAGAGGAHDARAGEHPDERVLDQILGVVMRAGHAAGGATQGVDVDREASRDSARGPCNETPDLAPDPHMGELPLIHPELPPSNVGVRPLACAALWSGIPRSPPGGQTLDVGAACGVIPGSRSDWDEGPIEGRTGSREGW